MIVGAGFAGLYMLHRTRGLGLTARVFERGHDVGGTWYWNRYPGARCDIESIDYSYSFDESLTREWRWTERYAAQPEILAYLGHAADRFDMRKDISFGTTVTAADWNDTANEWTVHCDSGETVRATYCVMATGCLSVVKQPDFAGLADFGGEWYHTGRWPHRPVDFAGKTVAVIGTGSSGIQAIPRIAAAARHLYVLQRTPNYSMPAQNRRLDDREIDDAASAFADRRRICEHSDAGVPHPPPTTSTFEVSAEQRRTLFEEGWARGGINALSAAFTDFFTDETANGHAQDFARAKIREIVRDPATAELLCPKHHIGTKRTCVDIDYFETYNRDNVELIDVRAHPIERITSEGIAAVRPASRRRHRRVRDRVRRHHRRACRHRHPRSRRHAAAGQMGRRSAHAARAADRGLPQPVHDHRSRQPVGSEQHGRVDRAARGLDRRLPDPPPQARSRSHRGVAGCRSAMDGPRCRHGRRNSVPTGEFVVPRREHTGQAPRTHALCRRVRPVSAGMRRRSSPTGTRGSCSATAGPRSARSAIHDGRHHRRRGRGATEVRRHLHRRCSAAATPTE